MHRRKVLCTRPVLEGFWLWPDTERFTTLKKPELTSKELHFIYSETEFLTQKKKKEEKAQIHMQTPKHTSQLTFVQALPKTL